MFVFVFVLVLFMRVDAVDKKNLLRSTINCVRVQVLLLVLIKVTITSVPSTLYLNRTRSLSIESAVVAFLGIEILKQFRRRLFVFFSFSLLPFEL